MLYYKLPHIIYRDYLDFGYLTDNRNFGYDTASKSGIKVGDRILSKSGSIFYSVLTERPQSVSEIAQQLLRLFVGVTTDEISSDVKEFFQELAADGFIGLCSSDLSYPIPFSYKDRLPKILKDQQSVMGVEERAFYEKWGQNYHLSRVHLEVSAICNERCTHCYFPENYRNGIMSRDLFLRILEQCKESKVLNITLSGGEPMLNPNLLFFIKQCRENNISINLLTNLTLLSDEMLKVFVDTPLLSIQTSLYSMDAVVHDSITSVRGSFEKTKRAIMKLYKHDIPMHINCPIMKQNKDTYQDVLNWSKDMNIEADSDYMLFGCFDGSGSNLKCRLELSELDSIIVDEFETDAIDKDNYEMGKRDYPICPVCISSVCISHKGKVYPCEGWQGYLLGNINDVSLKQIWEESETIKSLRSLSYKDFPECSMCDDKDYCSICLIRNANESSTGDFRMANSYFCAIARKKHTISQRKANNKKTFNM